MIFKYYTVLLFIATLLFIIYIAYLYKQEYEIAKKYIMSSFIVTSINESFAIVFALRPPFRLDILLGHIFFFIVSLVFTLLFYFEGNSGDRG